MGFDASAIEEIETVEIEIDHPKTGLPTGAKVVVASYTSERVKKVRVAFANMALKTRSKKMSAEQVEQLTLDLAAAAIVSWTDFEDDGKPLECTPANARKLVQHEWLFDQINEAAADSAAFIKA